jgi:hypothetical protein
MCDSSIADPPTSKSFDHVVCIARQWRPRPSDPFTGCASTRHAGDSSLADQLSLELSKHRAHVEHRSPARSRRVDCLLVDVEPAERPTCQRRWRDSQSDLRASRSLGLSSKAHDRYEPRSNELTRRRRSHARYLRAPPKPAHDLRGGGPSERIHRHEQAGCESTRDQTSTLVQSLECGSPPSSGSTSQLSAPSSDL